MKEREKTMLRLYAEMSRVYLALTDRLEREEGQAMVEYALILALISIVTIGVLKLIGVSVTNLFGKVNSALSGAST
jgi:pilus assembly protein Flp/PilA